MGLGINVQGAIIPVVVVVLARKPLAVWVGDRLTGLKRWRGSGHRWICHIPVRKSLDGLVTVEGVVVRKLRHACRVYRDRTVEDRSSRIELLAKSVS
jgi:hypothetical protein